MHTTSQRKTYHPLEQPVIGSVDAKVSVRLLKIRSKDAGVVTFSWKYANMWLNHSHEANTVAEKESAKRDFETSKWRGHDC